MFNRNCMRQMPMMTMPGQESLIDIDNNSGNIDIDLNQDQMTNVNSNAGGMMMGTTQAPIIEPVRERVVNRTIEHVVPHVCPVRTRIVNHHVFKHTYQPSYSCCEENVCENVQCGSCCNY